MSSEFVPFLKGDFDARQHKIYNLPDGVDPSDAATVGQLGGGGSQPWQILTVPFAFDTPDVILQPGIEIYVPTAGQIMTVAFISVMTAFDFTDPAQGVAGTLQFNDQIAGDGILPNGDLSSVDPTYPTLDTTGHLLGWADKNGAVGAINGHFADATPLNFYIDDGNGGDPGSTQGEGAIVLMVATPS